MKEKRIFACTSLLIAIVASFSGSLGENINNAYDHGTNWDGTYSTNMKIEGEKGEWAFPNTLLVSWGKDLQYGGSTINGAKFFNNSSISWSEDSILGTGQIWFTSGDNRSFYWPNGAVTGRVVTGKIALVSGGIVDFRGLSEIAYSDSNKDQINCVGASCQIETNSCAPCSNGKVCINGQCACPSGTTDCFGQCLADVPCGGGCANGKVCENGKCICPSGTKGCNNRCIKVTECCGGCPTWKVCSQGSCVCPPGVKDCSDPLPP